MKDKKLYIGFTQNIQERILAHNEGLNKSTKGRRPLVLIYAESYPDESDARKQEKYYKTGQGRETLKKKLSNTYIGLGR